MVLTFDHMGYSILMEDQQSTRLELRNPQSLSTQGPLGEASQISVRWPPMSDVCPMNTPQGAKQFHLALKKSQVMVIRPLCEIFTKLTSSLIDELPKDESAIVRLGLILYLQTYWPEE